MKSEGFMNIEQIKDYLETYEPRPVDVKNEYAVAIPLYFDEDEGEWKLIFELRSKNINQPNEVSFPGGKIEAGEDAAQAALRETCEELNIGLNNIELLGEANYLVAHGLRRIRSFVIKIKDINFRDIDPNPDEVEKLFLVPFRFFLEEDPMEYALTSTLNFNESFPYELIPNGKDYKFIRPKEKIIFYRYEDYVIWGFTAKITREFINIYNDIIKL
ncbi:NUDIX hydrolase [Peptoniphilaceae bacterium SGI.131]